MKKILFPVIFILTCVSLAFAAQKNKIELSDGSTIEGEVVSKNGGVYTIKNSIMGELKIDEAKVRIIRSEALAAGSSVPRGAGVPKTESPNLDNAVSQSEPERIQSEIMGNPDVMNAIPGLLANEDFQATLKDPEILAAAKSMDIKALVANEKFIKAVNSSEVRELSEKVEAQKNKG